MNDRKLSAEIIQLDDIHQEHNDQDIESLSNGKSQEFDEQRIIHTFAHCMWWVEQGDDLPKDEKQRNTQWENECYQWVRKAQLIRLHLHENKLMICDVSK